MTDFEKDREIIAAATPGPWVVCHPDDDQFMSAITVASQDSDGELDNPNGNIAATLLQSPRCVDIADGKWFENANFIAAARTRWPAALDRIKELETELAQLRAQKSAEEAEYCETDLISTQRNWRWKICNGAVYVHCGDGEWKKSANSIMRFQGLIKNRVMALVAEVSP